MLRSRLPAAVFVVLFAAVACADEAKYDLRGPASKKGQKITQTASMKLKDGKVTANSGKKSFTLEISMTGVEESVLEVLALSGREVTKARLKVVKRDNEGTLSFGGKEKKEKEESPLNGKTVLLEKDKGEWKRTLEGGKPTDKQAKELERLEPPADESVLYPAEKVAKGHKWEVKASAIPKIIGGNVTGITGKAKGHFRAVEKVNGEECAVIDFDLDIKGTYQSGGKKSTLAFKGKSTVHRSLKTGLDVKSKAEGTMRDLSKEDRGGTTVETDISGKVTYETTARGK